MHVTDVHPWAVCWLQDVMETTLALDNFRRACDAGRGAVFFSVARGKVAEGIDFDRHYGEVVTPAIVSMVSTSTALGTPGFVAVPAG